MASCKKYGFLFASVLAIIIFNNGTAIEEETEALGNQQWLTVSLSSLFPSSTCTPNFPGVKKNSSLQVMQRHGPCWEQKHGKAEPNESPTHIDILLSEDERRVNSIQSKLSKRFSHENIRQPDFANKPVSSGLPISASGYIVTVGLGSPKMDSSLIIDTGHGITWTQCQPCVAKCYNQREPIFDPSKSTTYSPIKCPSSTCTQILSAGKYQECANTTTTCVYKVEYIDFSFSRGFLSKERLTIAPGNTFDNFLFGCGQNNGGNSFGGSAGILGLNRHPISFVQQTSSTYNKVFSYCLPSTTSSYGHLTFGSDKVTKDVQYTPIIIIPNLTSLYGINIIGITVGGTELSSVASTLSSAKAIIDIGTTITRLPPSVYVALRSVFQQKMAMYPMASNLEIFDTCYDLSGYETVIYPEINLVFNGGVKLNLYKSGIFYSTRAEQVCLAFAPNMSDEDVLILGNAQQRTVEVVYDLNAERLGFGQPGSCI